MNRPTQIVKYHGKFYRVAYQNFLGAHLYGLASRTQGGSIFPAAKTDCTPVAKH